MEKELIFSEGVQKERKKDFLLEKMLNSKNYNINTSKIEIKRIIKEFLLRAEKKKGGLLEEEFELPMHIHFWLQHLERYGAKGINLDYEKKLDPQNTEEVIYETEKNFELNIGSQKISIPKLINIVIKNIEKIEEDPIFQEKIKEIKKILENGDSILVLTNHSDWSTQMIAPYILEKNLKNFPIDRHLCLLGPAATTIKKQNINPRDIARAVAKVIIPIPSTKRAMPQGIDDKIREKIDEHIKKYNIKIMRALFNFLEEGGKIIHIAPSGTTDEKKGGRLIVKKPAQATLHLIKKMNEKGVYIVTMGINSNLFKKWNGVPSPQEIQLKIGEILPPNSIKTEEDQKRLMQNIASLIEDENGEKIGEYEEN